MEAITWNKVPGKPALAKLWQRVNCHDGSIRLTPQEVSRANDEFLDLFPCAHAGGAHVAIADDNHETHLVAGCLLQLLEEHGTQDDRSAAESIHYLCCVLRLDDEERVHPDVDEYEFFDEPTPPAQPARQTQLKAHVQNPAAPER